MTGKALNFFLKYYSATDDSKSQTARRGDHWSPHFKLFKLFFLYKPTTQTNHKIGSLWYACSVANRHFKPNE